MTNKDNRFHIVVGDVSNFKADAVVNAANRNLAYGGGVCGAIFQAAGVAELTKACKEKGFCEVGEAVVTPAFNLPAKYIIHTVGPVWQGGNKGEAAALYWCYRHSIMAAFGHECKSVAFPLISSGIFGYPKDKAWERAITACLDYLSDNPEKDITVYLLAYRESDKELGEKMLSKVLANAGSDYDEAGDAEERLQRAHTFAAKKDE